MKSKKVILAIMFAIFIANVALYYPTTYLRINIVTNETNQTEITKTCGSTPEIISLINLIRILSRIVVPFILVLVLNSLLIYKLIKRKKNVQANSNLRRGYNFSKIIAVTCLLFVLSFIPLVTVLIVFNLGVDINSSVRTLAVFDLVQGIAQSFTLLNYLSQFLINLKFSSMFREEILIIFKGTKKIFQKQNL
jgi:hypothetical protein